MIGPDPASPDVAPRPALVIFTDAREIRWLRLLRPGFRHVLVALRDPDGGWVLVNPLSHQMRVDRLAPMEPPDLASWFHSQGHTVLPTMTRRAPRREAPWAPMTCVEVVKRLLGLHARWVWTPWALYRHVLREEARRPARGGSAGRLLLRQTEREGDGGDRRFPRFCRRRNRWPGAPYCWR
jgi:hypothetical protein